MYEPALSRLIAGAISRLEAEMGQVAPVMARQSRAWLQHLAGSPQPEDYFKHPLAFPALLLPWWLEQQCRGEPDPALQAELVYSTINGYYFIRLIDNLMDGHATVELKLLPVLAFFHTRFQAAYQRFFAHGHPFWDFFETTWFYSAEVVMIDAGLVDLDRDCFEQMAARKISPAKIPLAAVCYQHDRPDLIVPWSGLVDRLGCWHQLLNDLLGWRRDYARGTRTYFLAEAERQRSEAEPVAGWVARAGFAWAVEQLDGLMTELQTMAGRLQSPELAAYLQLRQAMVQQQREDIAAGLKVLVRLAALEQKMRREEAHA